MEDGKTEQPKEEKEIIESLEQGNAPENQMNETLNLSDNDIIHEAKTKILRAYDPI